MEPQISTSIVKHIELYVNSSTSHTQQNASVNAIANFLKNDIITMEYLVREMELYLTTTDHVLRARGMLLLAEVLGQLLLKPLASSTVHTLVGFFTERLTDWRALRGALIGCLALLRRKSSTGVVNETDAKALAQSYIENLQVQSLVQHDRKLCFELLECLVDCHPESIIELGDQLVYGVCEAIDGEKDPQCLMHIFHIVESLARIFPDPDGPVASFAKDLFDIIGCYFPIHYTHQNKEDVDVSRDDLSRALMMAFSASPYFEANAIPLLLEKLSSALPLAKIDSLKYLSDCIGKYGSHRMAKHAAAIWSSIKAVIFHLPSESGVGLTLDVPGSGFQENEITKDSLNLLRKFVSNDDNGLLNLVLQDKDVSSLIDSVVKSQNSCSSQPDDMQELYAVGRLLCALSEASAAACNVVFETVFLRLLNSAQPPRILSSQDSLSVESNMDCHRLNLSALYLCVTILSACRELAVVSVKLSSNTSFVDDTWCQMLTDHSTLLMKIFVSVAASSCDMYHDADVSLGVKGLQILTTFPGGHLPVSSSVFDSILAKLMYIVTEKSNMIELWKVSLNALVEIGTFLHEYLYPEKVLSYVSTVVEKIILMISLDDSTMPYSQVLEALSEIGASGLSFMSRIVQGVQEALSAKFNKVYVDGDLKHTSELVQLLECYSMKLLPRYHTVKGLEGVPSQLAYDIWDQIEANMHTSYFVKGEELQSATKRAIMLAVARCSEDDQCALVDKAVKIVSSDKSFSPNVGSTKLEETESLIGRDDWLLSLFASVVIALHPQTQIPNIRAVIELLLKTFVKGHIISAQALGSIVNKMLLKDELQSSSHIYLDDALELIFEITLGSCRDYFLANGSEMTKQNELFLNMDDCVLFQTNCISGLAWIGKGLLMRGHEKLKDITMIFLKFLASTSSIELESLSSRKGMGVFSSLRRSAADAFHIFMSDSEDCLNKTFHATVRPLYKQRFFAFVIPIMLSEAKKSHSHEARVMLYRATGHVICDTPLVAILAENKKLLPVLVDMICILGEDPLNKDMIYSLLLMLSGLLMDKIGKDTATDHAHGIISCLTRLLSYPHKMLVRETAVQCLVAMSRMSHVRIYPMRAQVLRDLSKVLDDPKRSVRHEAVRCRQAWASIV